MTVTFFGHSLINADIKADLLRVLENLIENEGADLFYIGNHGDFDAIVHSTLKKLCEKYRQIKYYIVFAYIPTDKRSHIDYEKTIYPDILETVPKKFAIDKRNRWMLEKSDTVVTYVKTVVGGAAKYKSIAERAGKRIINIFG